jgi:hypothetical protein
MESGFDVWLVDRQGHRELLVGTRSNDIQPAFSPDGKWLAYTSNPFGRVEVFVRPFPGPGSPFQITNWGGMDARWSRDQRELFFSRWAPPPLGQKALRAVQITTEDGELSASLPEILFKGAFTYTGYGDYDVGPDGRFLLTKLDPEHRSKFREAMAPTRIELVQNWFEELHRKVPITE